MPPAPDVEGLSISERTASLSKRAVNTVNALADAGAAQFRARGYRSTSVDDIVEAANVARGTFYKYFSDKQDLLAAVAAEIYGAGMAFAERIAHVDPVAKKSTLRHWLGTYVEFYDRYSGCIEAWAEGTTDDPTIVSIGENGQAADGYRRGQDADPRSGSVSVRPGGLGADPARARHPGAAGGFRFARAD